MPSFHEVPPPPLPGESGVKGPLIWRVDRWTIFKDWYFEGAGGYWATLRAAALSRDGRQCSDRELGPCSGPLQCHHITYPPMLRKSFQQDWLADRPENVATLCRHHHAARHPAEVAHENAERAKEADYHTRLGWSPLGIIDLAMLQRLSTKR